MGDKTEALQKDAAAYYALLEKLGIQDQDTSEYGNRAHRRFNFDLPETTIHLRIGDDTCRLFDVSVGGLSFYSGNEYESGKKLALDFDGRYVVDVVIVNSIPGQNAQEEEETVYRHGARFEREGDGYKCVVAVLQYYFDILQANL